MGFVYEQAFTAQKEEMTEAEYNRAAKRAEEDHFNQCMMWVTLNRHIIDNNQLLNYGVYKGIPLITVILRDKKGNEVFKECFTNIEQAHKIVLASSTLREGDGQFKLGLAAKVGEVVWYINPQFNCNDIATYDVNNIVQGVVTEVSIVSDSDCCTLKIKGSNGERYSAVQDCFFHSLQDAIEVVGCLTKNEDSYNGEDWYHNLKSVLSVKRKHMYKYTIITDAKKWQFLDEIIVYGYGKPMTLNNVVISEVYLTISEDSGDRLKYKITPVLEDAKGRFFNKENEGEVTIGKAGSCKIVNKDYRCCIYHIDAEPLVEAYQGYKIVETDSM